MPYQACSPEGEVPGNWKLPVPKAGEEEEEAQTVGTP